MKQWENGMVDEGSFSPQLAAQIEKAAAVIKAGGIVAFPTDTVYGLGADPFNRDAIDRIYRVKNRDRTLPLPVLLPDREAVYSVVSKVPEKALPLMEHYWPGGLTLVFYRSDRFPGYVTAKSEKIAVRVPDHAVPLMLMKKAGVPVAGTSANLSNRPSALTAQEVIEQLGNAVDIVIDGGRCPGGVESTIIDVTGPEFEILRTGAVSREDIELFLKRG
jgi:L-threonylcarbamoyladenylate synthase